MTDKPKCRYWQDANINSGGRCAISLYPNPSYGACSLCLEHGRVSRGFGDTLAKFIHTVSFGYFRKTRDCNCYNRQKAMNVIWPYRATANRPAETPPVSPGSPFVMAPAPRRRKCGGCGKKKDAA